MKRNKMQIPKTLIIGGVTWTVVIKKDSPGGSFRWHKQEIGIGRDCTMDRKITILVHEVAEIILTNNIMRYQKCLDGEMNNGDFLFVFNHDQFGIFTEELSGVLKQIGLGK
jgi:hypothetical protein